MSTEEKFNQAAGSVKEGVGKLIGDKGLESEGAAEKVASKVKEVAEDAKDAIEGFVRCLLDEHKMVKNPKIQVHTRKKKCFVYVEGTAVLSDNIANKFEVVQNEITQGLKEFFGIDREVKLEVSVKEYDPQKAAKKIVSRVK